MFCRDVVKSVRAGTCHDDIPWISLSAFPGALARVVLRYGEQKLHGGGGLRFAMG